MGNVGFVLLIDFCDNWHHLCVVMATRETVASDEIVEKFVGEF